MVERLNFAVKGASDGEGVTVTMYRQELAETDGGDVTLPSSRPGGTVFQTRRRANLRGATGWKQILSRR